ncbi:MAG TPA: putative lipid II flippase FtsW [Vicinamibacterales bacterium]|nr:putative lipid II flippase FtsW [Vicinamibacterales bacterium]
MARTLKSDRVLFVVTLLLVCSSIVMVYSASAVQALDRQGSPSAVMLRQLVWAVLGVVAMLVAMRIDYHELRRPVVIWWLVGITVAALVAVFFFEARNSTRRWILFGPFSLQPSELAKLTAIIFAAALLERRMHRVNELGYAVAPIGVIAIGLTSLILYQPDFGTAVVLIAVVCAVVFGAGLSYRYLAGTFLLLLPAAIALVVMSPYRMRRVFAFLNPEQDPLGASYQLNQSLIAIGSGGGFGRGLMDGVQKLYYIPESHTDFIYAVVGEELGLVGTTAILACFAIITWRGLRASLVAPDRFGALLGIGLTLMVSLQAFVNMSVVLGLGPTKGIPLPFVSNGGSSLVVSLIAMGILLNISQQGSPGAAAALEARG